MPPTLAAGIFGMNIKAMPLVDGDNGFILVCGILMLSSAIAYFIMKRIGIIR
jgi:zinc transporter